MSEAGKYDSMYATRSSAPARPPKLSFKQNAALLGLVAVGTLVVIVLLGWMNGHKPTKPELVGVWVHHGSGLTVTLDLKADGTFTRQPDAVLTSNVWGAAIPFRGTWSLDEATNCLLLSGAPQSGEFRPFLSGRTLKLGSLVNGRVEGTFNFEKQQ